MFFADLAFGTLNKPQDTLTGIAFCPPELAAALALSLGGEDMLKLAFWMTRDSSLGIKEAAKLAVSTRAGFADEHVAGKYAQFKMTYNETSQFSGHACKSARDEVKRGKLKHAQLQECLDRLDPRVSEVVQQWLSIRPDHGATQRQIQAYLPFLFDDPSRASAWGASAHIRRLGWLILALHGPPFTLTECDRRGERMTGIDVPLLSPQDILAECRTLLLHIQGIIETARSPSTVNNDTRATPENWALYMLTLVLRSTAASSTAPPARQQILHFATSLDSTYAWPHIHLSAQCESTFYSLRMFTQILDVCLCGDFPIIDREAGEDEGNDELVKVFRELRKLLETLPNVEDVFLRAGEGFRERWYGVQERRVLERIMDEVFGREERGEAEGFAKQRGKKRKGGTDAKKVQAGGNDGIGGRKVVNMFEVLGYDA